MPKGIWIALLLGLLATILCWAGLRRVPLSILLMPASSLASDLNTGDPDTMREALGLLIIKKNKEYADKAIPLLQHADDYVWFNAALYVGSCGRKEAIPYLIKGLKHPAWRAHDDCRSYLINLTCQDFGKVFPDWKAWYEKMYPDEKIDWRLTSEKTNASPSNGR